MDLAFRSNDELNRRESHRSKLDFIRETLVSKLGVQAKYHGENESLVLSSTLYPRQGANRLEALAVVVKLTPPGVQNPHLGSESIALALAYNLQKATWLSKNIVFVFAAHEDGVKSWLDLYTKPSYFSGILRGAICLDLRGDVAVPTYQFQERGTPCIAAILPGFGGRLPNLDLFNTFRQAFEGPFPIHLDRRENVDRIRKIFDAFAVPKVFEPYMRRLETLLRFMSTIAFEQTRTDWHGHFIERNIDAFTVTFSEAAENLSLNKNKDSNLYVREEVMCALERTIRSLSNLSEKLHQSYYFYLLPSTIQFVSIDECIGPFVLLLMPIALSGMFSKNTAGDKFRQNAISALAIFFVGASGYFIACMGSTSTTMRIALFAPVALLKRIFTRGDAAIAHSLRRNAMLLLYTEHACLGFLNLPLAMVSAIFACPLFAFGSRNVGSLVVRAACLCGILCVFAFSESISEYVVVYLCALFLPACVLVFF